MMSVTARFLCLIPVIIPFELHYSSTTIIVRVGKPKSLARKGLRVFDPLETFGLVARQTLCDTILTARHYVGEYCAGSTSNYTIASGASLWEPSYDLGSENYQRNIIYGGRYTLKDVIVDKPRERIKTMICTSSEDAQWHVTFGAVEKFMYLIERFMSPVSHLRVTSIIEPNAILFKTQFNEEELLYFSQRLSDSREKLESLTLFGVNDRVRVCSSVFDLLIDTNLIRGRRNKYLNYVHVKTTSLYPGRPVSLKLNEDIIHFRALPCWINFEDPLPAPLFYLLLDSLNQGSVFVIVEEEITDQKRKRDAVVKWLARVRNVGALLNPINVLPTQARDI